EIHVREMPGLVPWSTFRFLQPFHSVVQVALCDEISADIVVRIAESIIDFDRFMTFSDSVIDSTQHLVYPAAKSIRLRGRVDLNRLGIEFDRLCVVAAQLMLIGISAQLQCLLLSIRLAHHRIFGCRVSDVYPMAYLFACQGSGIA